jgi:ABC-type glycerol-3-phosphate transport system substrate-binding protein
MTRGRHHKVIGLALVCSVAMFTAACSSSKKSTAADNGPVTITVNFEPDNTNAAAQAAFLADVNTFQAAHKNITVTANTSAMDPKTFPTKLAGGQVENVFYTYFTDPANLIAHHQVADISSYLKEFPAVASISPAYMKIYSDSSGHVYGLPISNYSMGLVYNRALFTQAGLDPNSPPTTWADVQTDATKIAALGNGIVGYADYSKSNTGGWHFTAEMYSRGGDIASNASGSWKADFNNPTGVAVLQQLHDMRYTDKSMGERQLLEYPDILSMMGAGKLGMYIAAADNVTQVTQQFKIDVKDMGFGPMPDGKGTLGGGAGFMFNVKDTPAQIRRPRLADLRVRQPGPVRGRGEDRGRQQVHGRSAGPEHLDGRHGRQVQPDPDAVRERADAELHRVRHGPREHPAECRAACGAAALRDPRHGHGEDPDRSERELPAAPGRRGDPVQLGPRDGHVLR